MNPFDSDIKLGVANGSYQRKSAVLQSEKGQQKGSMFQKMISEFSKMSDCKPLGNLNKKFDSRKLDSTNYFQRHD